ncbi:MAG: rRNA maturation RNase YbeY [Bacteroidota bacterium]
MAIEFHYEGEFKLESERKYIYWLNRVLESEGKAAGILSYVFCDDEYLAQVNLKYLGHDAYTDIITFDYSENDEIVGDIFVSYQRVAENADTFEVAFVEELRRVMVHGVLHLVGYDDKNKQQQSVMRRKEEEKMKMFHVEH